MKCPTIALLLPLLLGCDANCPEAPSDAAVAAENVRLVRRTVDEGYNQRDPTVFDAAYDSAAVVWNNGQLLQDAPILEGFRRDLREYDQQFSEWRIDVEDIFATSEKVAVRWIFTGRLRQNGQQVARTGNWIGRIVNGKIVEVWEATDE